MVFEESGEVQTGIVEACNACVVFCEELDECWNTKDIWGGLITESFNGGATGIPGDDNSLLFELLYLILKQQLSCIVLCEKLDDC